jgi:hypothetical protein
VAKPQEVSFILVTHEVYMSQNGLECQDSSFRVVFQGTDSLFDCIGIELVDLLGRHSSLKNEYCCQLVLRGTHHSTIAPSKHSSVSETVGL